MNGALEKRKPWRDVPGTLELEIDWLYTGYT
jgi:hypothetical protein